MKTVRHPTKRHLRSSTEGGKLLFCSHLGSLGCSSNVPSAPARRALSPMPRTPPSAPPFGGPHRGSIGRRSFTTLPQMSCRRRSLVAEAARRIRHGGRGRGFEQPCPVTGPNDTTSLSQEVAQCRAKGAIGITESLQRSVCPNWH